MVGLPSVRWPPIEKTLDTYFYQKWSRYIYTPLHSAYSESGLGVPPDHWKKCDFAGTQYSTEWFSHLRTKVGLPSVRWPLWKKLPRKRSQHRYSSTLSVFGVGFSVAPWRPPAKFLLPVTDWRRDFSDRTLAHFYCTLLTENFVKGYTAMQPPSLYRTA